VSDEKLDLIIETLGRIEAKLSAIPKPTTSAGEVASDYDLDGRFGDEDIRKDPTAKYWQGESFVGTKMSQTTPEFLDAYAKYKDACAYMNEKKGDPEKAKYIGYDRKSAARARGWSKRLRDGYKKVSTVPQSEFAGDDEPPF